jgi:hypothetical protein
MNEWLALVVNPNVVYRVAFGDYNPKQGTLAVCEGSHQLEGYRGDYYGIDSKASLPLRLHL